MLIMYCISPISLFIGIASLDIFNPWFYIIKTNYFDNLIEMFVLSALYMNITILVFTSL